HAHRGGPVSLVPPDAVARVEALLRRADARLDAVHVVEPVLPPPARGRRAHAVDSVHEAPSVTSLDLAFSLEQAHRRLAARQLVLTRAYDLDGAEVARDRQRGARALRLGTDAAAC